MRLAAALGIAVHRGRLLRLVLGLPDPAASAAPDVVDAATGRAIDVLPGRRAYAEGARDGPRRGPGR